MATLTVGPGKQFATIAAAVAAAGSGDVIEVQAGTYTNDFVTIYKNLTLKGVGGMVNMVATQSPPNGKAIMTVNGNITVDGFSFSGAKVPDMNGAGIRYEGGHLTISNSHFHNNQMGLLSADAPSGSITISKSQFNNNGIGTGVAHNLYVSRVGELTITDSYFHDASVGHNIKSRAYTTTITNTRIYDNNSTTSYSVDLPNGGKAVLSNNIIEQGPYSQNPAIIHFGGEGAAHAGSSLQMTGNTVINKLSSWPTLLYNQTGVTAEITGTKVYGLTSSQMTSGPASVSNTTFLSAAPALDTSAPWTGSSAPPPAPPPAEPPPPTSGATLSAGTGPDALVLKISQDHYLGDAQYIVKVNGVQIGGTFTASATKTSGLHDTLTLRGDWAPGTHKVEVVFLNDAWGGSKALDRNLYVEGASFNGQAVAGASLALERNGPASFSFIETAGGSATPPASGATLSAGTGPDALVLKISQDHYLGDAQYIVKVNGVQIGGTFTASATKTSGLHDTLTLRGDWAPGTHKVEVVFLNDAWGGSKALDRNLYVEGASFNGQAVAGASLALERNGPASFSFIETAMQSASHADYIMP
ncbi:carbohydrate-binding domain-containing protein [Crenalkalicoccus roseus]|uniref:carbohydrate-binding domain-containing protein n=1 Tax=Crenalkalicoccus roseus TaxID=1485588 RepID=UPI0010812E7F|nr:carbohydrate-binding domain-containing protein [Crenalkalicoccus roseus]